MFRTKYATISPTWTLSCQKIADPTGSDAILAAHPLDYVQFRANGSHHRLQPTPLRGLVSRRNLVMCGTLT
jgi:hypothetical protein